MSRPVIGVLALQGDVREHVRALTRLGVATLTVRRPEELARVHGLIVPGGESTTISRLAEVFGLADPVRERVADGLPVYGSCAGMIMLAGEVLDGRPDQRTFGGIDMVVRRNAFGRQIDSFERNLDIIGILGPPVRAVFIRAPVVEKIGDDVSVLATVSDGPSPAGDFDGAGNVGRIVAVRQGSVLATSFHPELTGDARVHELFVHMVRES